MARRTKRIALWGAVGALTLGLATQVVGTAAAEVVADQVRAESAPSFTAVTWNLQKSTGRQARPVLKRFAKRGASVLILQEVKKHKRVLKTLRNLGWKVRHAKPEFAVAWRADRFTYVSHKRVRMAKTCYWTCNYGLVVRLDDRKSNRRLRVLSYHTPAHVQRANWDTWPKAWQALKQADATWDRMARTSKVPMLAAGDDNVDEWRGWKCLPKSKRFQFLVKGALRQHQAPSATHGKRRIDDFRTDRHGPRLKRVGKGAVLGKGPSDHRPYVQTFAWV